METISVIVAAIGAFAFGSVWYGALSDSWIAASGVKTDAEGKPANMSNPMVYVTGFICALIVAGMMRHIFSLSGIETLGAGFIAGFGIGLFLSVPWLVTNYAFAGRPFKLMIIDGGYATIGSAFIGLILAIF